jgi:hypothetical protein
VSKSKKQREVEELPGIREPFSRQYEVAEAGGYRQQRRQFLHLNFRNKLLITVPNPQKVN